MRDDNMDIIVNNLFEDPETRKELTESQKNLLIQVADCYNLQLQKPMYSQKNLRNYLMNKYGVSRIQAYRIIEYASVALGNVQASQKNWIRKRVEFLIEESYTAAMSENYKLSESLTKMAKVLAKAFATDQDDGELIDAQKYLEISKVVIVTDPKAIGIDIPETQKKEIERLLRKYEIEDAECEEIKDESDLPS